MDDTTILGATLSQLGKTVKQGAKQVVKIPQELVQDVGGQIGSAKQNPNENKALGNKQDWKSDEERVKFLKDLYGSSEKNSSEESLKTNQPQVKTESPEEQKKLIELRNKLHKENYYEPTFNPVKKQEERPAEKVEKEKKQEMADLQKKEEKKPPPLAVVREQNKTEMFRGTSG